MITAQLLLLIVGSTVFSFCLLLLVFTWAVRHLDPYHPNEHDVLLRDDSQRTSIEALVNAREPSDYAYLADCALMSSNVYGTTQGPQPKAYWKPYHLRHLLDASNSALTRHGFKVQVWTRQTPNQSVAIVAFRGTANIGSLFSNGNWFWRYLPAVRDHYRKTEILVPILVKELRKYLGSSCKLIATGHSLGGGLAQYAGYLTEGGDIDLVFAFNSSPTTGYRETPKSNSQGLRIYRINQSGELLTPTRLITKLGYKVNPKPNENPWVMEVVVHRDTSLDKGLKHAMQPLAEWLDQQRREEQGRL